MKIFIKTLFFVIFSFIVLNLSACSQKKEELPEVNNLPHYSEVTIVENTEGTSNLYKVENKGLHKIGTAEDVSDIVYNVPNSMYAYLVNVSKGQNFNESKITVIKDGKMKELKDFYAAADLKVNSSGSKLAFRTFKSDSLDSAEGLRIYDIDSRKYTELNSDVLVSGNLYDWIDENKIIYYGTVEGKENSTKIYGYDFTNNKEEVYLENIDGYCMHFITINKDIFFLVRQGDKDKLYYYNNESKQVKNIESNIETIYSSIVDSKSGDVFFFGSEDKENLALYKFSPKDIKINRITYDFPRQLDVSSGIALDGKGNVYFTGIQNEERNKKDVFMYDTKEGAINLVSNQEGNYRVFSSKKSF